MSFMRTSKRARMGTRWVILASVLSLVLAGMATPASALPRVKSVTVGPQTGSLTEGALGSITYDVTVVKGNRFSLTAALSISGLPTGATATFLSGTLTWPSFAPANATQSTTLTIDYDGTVPAAGSTNFTVTAERSSDPADTAAGDGTLTIDASGGLTPQTITFGALGDVHVGEPDFAVSATASSGLTVAFSASGACTIAVDMVTLTGPGTCTITATQPGDLTFAAAPPVDRTFTIVPLGAVEFDLWAVSGSTTLPGPQSVPVWGYTTDGSAATLPGGPTLVVNEGDAVAIRLHNQLGEHTSLLVQGQGTTPDLTGIGSGGSRTYVFTAARPGTYLYEAGLVKNAQHQVAMGLYGALIVRPTSGAGFAYNDPDTGFDDEATLVLSEIDPALNTSADPSTFDMRKYRPTFFLINGRAYPDTAEIPTAAGNRVLLRYVNAGNQYHSMSVQGAHQSLIAFDGSKLAFARRVVAETFGPGQTTDAIYTVPASTTVGSRLAINDGSLLLHNGNQSGFGGMLTFLNVGTGPALADTGPVASDVAYDLGSQTLTASLDDPITAQSNVAAAEYFLDTLGGVGTGTPMTGSFDSSIVSVSATGVAVPPGEHVLYVRGQDAIGNWGVVSSVLVDGGDVEGPVTESPSLDKSPANGTASVAVHATGNDTSTGNSNIVAAEYSIDGAPAVAMTVNVEAPIASLDAVISAATVNGLAEGPHVVSIRSQDAALNWGAAVNVDLVVDKTAPAASNVSVAPNPNDGTLAFNPNILGTQMVRVSATLSDPTSGGVNSDLRNAEAFIDTVGANGKGIVVAALDGVFDSPTEDGYTDIPLTTIVQLSNGNHTIYVHARDAAGNWGPMSTTILVIDKTRPAVSGLTAAPSIDAARTPVTLTATATAGGAGVTAAEWFVGADPGAGNGTSMTVSGTGPWSLSTTSAIDVSNTATWPSGYYTFSVRAMNGIGKWGTPATVVVVIGNPPPVFRGLFFSTTGNATVPTVAGVADDADIYGWNGSVFSRDWNANLFGVLGSANVDAYDRVDATHFYVSFADDATLGGTLTVQDEDIVYYNNGVWSVFFDGTAAGLTSGNLDVDAIDILGGTVYLSTLGNTNPPGAGGTADDSDIYRWNGGSSFTRVWDATANGVAAGANVDGLSMDDLTHFFVSFTGNTTLTGPGTVQDEDVVAFSAGTWSVYFNGTGQGLTAAGHDLDAIDIPAP